MTRIKEHLELLTFEMERFQGDVKRLETINENMKNIKVSIDLDELKSELGDYHAHLERHRENQDRFYTRLEWLVKRAEAYTNRVIIAFIVLILITAASLIYVSNTKTVLEQFKSVSHSSAKTTLNP
ncbi:DUF6730 family protein [Galbibacter sp.]|uniref:DUF6730 family protein n=1 Tax=Galbibacter sp. TaxID=2918471 RepID=UPI003A8EC2F6